jgi:hypothetical protein
VRHAGLALELADSLDPMLRDKHVEIWRSTRRGDDDDL